MERRVVLIVFIKEIIVGCFFVVINFIVFSEMGRGWKLYFNVVILCIVIIIYGVSSF